MTEHEKFEENPSSGGRTGEEEATQGALSLKVISWGLNRLGLNEPKFVGEFLIFAGLWVKECLWFALLQEELSACSAVINSFLEKLPGGKGVTACT